MDEALDFRRTALEHRLRHEGPDAWWTNRCRLDLARLLQKLDQSPEALQQITELETKIENLETMDDSDRQLLDDARSLRQTIESSR